MSMTVLKALELMPSIGATKLPAAPALRPSVPIRSTTNIDNSHHIVNASKLLDTLRRRGFETLNLQVRATSALIAHFYQSRVPPSYLAHVASSKANDLGARPSRRDIFRCGLCLFNVSAQDEGIRAESNQGSGLHAANGSRAAGDEYDLVLCRQSPISHAFPIYPTSRTSL